MTAVDSSTKQTAIASRLRKQIVTGAYPPGFRLPSRLDMTRSLRVSLNTVQRAMELLEDEGFVTSRGRHGTAVSAHPPHLHRYGLLFPFRPTDSQWSSYWRALYEQALQTHESPIRQIVPYFGIVSDPQGEDAQRLQDDLERQRLAGIVAANGMPIALDLHGTPLVCVVVKGDTEYPTNALRVQLDVNAFFDRALASLEAAGCRSAATLFIQDYYTSSLEHLRKSAETHKLHLPEEWIQFAWVRSPNAAEHVLRLLFSKYQNRRPDALIVTDDTLSDFVQPVILGMGLRVPDDVKLVTYRNFPLSTPALLPSQNLGFDLKRILSTALQLIERARRGDCSITEVVLSPQFEHELSSSQFLKKQSDHVRTKQHDRAEHREQKKRNGKRGAI